MDQPKAKPKKRVDPYKGLKYIGYRQSQLPTTYSLADLTKYAKFYLAHKTKTLLKDPIWDEYTVEELLVEFYAHQMVDNKEFRIQFESQMGDIDGSVDDFASWADKQISEEAKIRDETLDQMEDSVSFDPSEVMGDDE